MAGCSCAVAVAVAVGQTLIQFDLEFDDPKRLMAITGGLLVRPTMPSQSLSLTHAGAPTYSAAAAAFQSRYPSSGW
jgi:hypothetical protein